MGSLSKRLQAIYSLVEQGSKVCDVGADHGYLGYQLLENEVVSYIQLVENKKGPFKALSKTFKDFLNDNRVLISLSDGLSALDPRVNILILSGLGAETIIKIINDNHDKLLQIDSLLISPHTKPHLVRKSLFDFGYKLAHEEIVKENGKLYIIMKYIKGKTNYSHQDLVYGTLLGKNDELTKEYLEQNALRFKKVLKENENGNKKIIK